MALLYFDSSALVKLYISERGSERVAELVFSDDGHSLATCAVTQVEFYSAIVRRRGRGDLAEGAPERAIEEFTGQFKSAFLRYPVDDRTLNLASALAARHPLRAYDAVQLAACLFPLG